MYNTKKVALLVLSTLSLFLIGCALQTVNGPRRFDPDTEPTPVPTSVVIVKPRYAVERGTVTRRIRLSGQVIPVIETEATFGLSGQVTTINVSRMDTVSAGDVLASLDTSGYESDLAVAIANRDVAQAQLDAVLAQVANQRRRAEIALEKALLNRDFAVDEAGAQPSAQQTLAIGLLNLDVEVAELAISELESSIDPALEAAVAQADVRVDELTALIERSQLVAKDDGTVLRIRINEGETIEAGVPAIVIANLDELEVTALVTTEGDMELLQEGQAVSLVRTSQPDDPVDGFIRLLPAPYGGGDELDEASIRIEFAEDVVIGGDSAEFELSDRITIDLLLAENENALWLPPNAIRDFKGRNFVVIEDAVSQRRVDVTLGLESKDRIEILEGVSAGDTVIGP